MSAPTTTAPSMSGAPVPLQQVTARGPSATDALLSMAAAQTPAELHAAHLALISTGLQVVSEPDTAGLLAGDGEAGRVLLGGPRPGPWLVRMSCAKRAYRLVVRDEVAPW